MQKVLLFLLVSCFGAKAHSQDSLQILIPSTKSTSLFTKKSLATPALCIGYGAASLYSKKLKEWNIQSNNRIAVKNPNNKVQIDDYLVYSPGVLTIGLELAGVKSMHDWKESMLLYAITNAVVSSVVFPLKYITKENRPDQTSLHSFPSGHTSMAFASAEFARMEYRNHPWVGILGYSMAATTGYLRMYNNRHWLGDVVAGAGVGILSAKFSYWVMKKTHKFLAKKRHVTELD
jgi:hypothetical protein